MGTVRGAFSYTIPNYREEEEKKKRQAQAQANAEYRQSLMGSGGRGKDPYYLKNKSIQQEKDATNAYWADQYAKSQAKIATAKEKYGGNGADPLPPTDTEPDKPNAPDDDLGGYARSYANFVPSQTYLKAMEYTQSLLDQLSSGRTSYTDKVNEMLKNIENKEPFSYDMNSDTLFQNALASAMNSGQLAMQDTMGQAAALTGGYGSTYSQAVGNQAYNQEIQGAYDQLPEFYQLARDTYDKDLQQLYDRLDMYNTADAIEYERLANAYGANADAAARLYDQEYNNYWQTQNFNEDSRRWAAEMGYKERQAKQSQSNWEKEYEMELAQADAKAQEAEAKANSYKEPTQTQMTKALDAYSKGKEAYRQFIDSLPSDVDVVAIDDYVQEYGRLPYSERTFSKSGKDTANVLDPFGWTIDRNDKATDQYGEEISLIDLYNKLVDEGVPASEAKKIVKQYNKY